MNTQTLERPTGTLQDEEMEHYVCPCNPALSMCGKVMDPAIFDPTAEDFSSCAICLLLDEVGPWQCPTCGCGNDADCEKCR